MGTSKIPYAGANGVSWPIVTGCSGTGCTARCWARAIAHRFGRPFAPTFHADKLEAPLHWRKPRRVLVAFTGDLFDAEVSAVEIAAAFGIMAACERHTFLVLTKQAARMEEWFAWLSVREEDGRRVFPDDDTGWLMRQLFQHQCGMLGVQMPGHHGGPWPLANVWLGVSVSTQADADARIPQLLRCPAAVRWVSYEPALGEVDFFNWLRGEHIHCDGCTPDGALCTGHDIGPRLDWIAASGESGPRARPCDLDWIRRVRDDCAAFGAAFAFKSQTAYPLLDGRRHDEMPIVRAS